MNNQSLAELNTALCKAIGLSDDEISRTSALTLRLEAGQQPVLTTEQIVFGNREVRDVDWTITTTPKAPKPAPFDLEAMCQQARSRLTLDISFSADHHRRALRKRSMSYALEESARAVIRATIVAPLMTRLDEVGIDALIEEIESNGLPSQPTQKPA